MSKTLVLPNNALLSRQCERYYSNASPANTAPQAKNQNQKSRRKPATEQVHDIDTYNRTLSAQIGRSEFREAVRTFESISNAEPVRLSVSTLL